MADTGHTTDTDFLDGMFDAARRHAPAPSADLMARLAADMEAQMPAPKPARAAPPRDSLFTRFAGLFAASGLTGAAALGVWIGFVMPDTLNAVAGYDTSDTTAISAFLPSADLAALSE